MRNRAPIEASSGVFIRLRPEDLTILDDVARMLGRTRHWVAALFFNEGKRRYARSPIDPKNT